MTPDKEKVEGIIIGVPLERIGETFGNRKGKVLTTRKTRDRGETWTREQLHRKKSKSPKSALKKSKDSEDFTLFLHVVGTNFRGKEYIKRFADLPLKRMSEVHNEWFKRGRDNIAVSHIDMSLSTAQYERALNWLQGVIVMKASEEPTERLSQKILKHLHIR